MAFDTTTTITWASEADQHNPDLNSWRENVLRNMIEDGKTSGEHLYISPVVTTRYWLDQSVAEAFAASITEAAATYNCAIVSIEFGTRQ